MITIFSVLGILLLIMSVVMLFIYPTLRKEPGEQDRFGRSAPPAPDFLLFWNPKRTKFGILISIGLLLLASSLMYARPGHQYYLVSPFGTKTAIFNSGYHFIVPFTRIQEWEKFADIKVITEGEPTDGIEGVIHGGIPIRFIDQVTATGKVSVRVQLPTDDVSFIQLAEEFRHPANLVQNTLVPTVREQVINTGYMFAAQDYISGSASDFRQTLDDQLKNGGFSVEKKEYFDTTYINTSIVDSADRKIREISTRYEVVKRKNANGIPIRIDHDIKKNNLIVSQVIVDQVMLEPAFRKRLEKQRDIASQKRIEMEAVEAAKIAQQKIIAEGERDKAAERVEKERDQIKTLIAIETKVKEEESKRQLAEIAVKTAELNKQREILEADAKSYKNRKLVQAGLTPQEQAEYELKMIDVATKNLSTMSVPDNIIVGGNDGNNATEALIQVKMLNDILNKSKK